jgi:hypothetical protein
MVDAMTIDSLAVQGVRNTYKTAAWLFVAGLLVAIALEALWRMLGYYSPNGYVVEKVARVLWPSSLFKLALSDGKDSWGQVSLVYALSFIANGVLYGVVGLLIGLARNLGARPR